MGDTIRGDTLSGDVILQLVPLTAQAFAPFGEVIETRGTEPRMINEGTCRRFDDLATVDVNADGGRPLISIFEATPREFPLRIRALERHPLASQAFFPLDFSPFLVVVAESAAAVAAGRLQAFVSSGDAGVNYRRGTWHHSLLAIGRISRFIVVDRGGPQENCDELSVDVAVWVNAVSGGATESR